MPAESKSEILQGTLDLMVLKTLAAMGSQHGYGIARRIEQISEEALQINSGHYLRLARPPPPQGLDHRRLGHLRKQSQSPLLLDHETPAAKQLHTEAQNWERISAVIGRVLRIAERS